MSQLHQAGRLDKQPRLPNMEDKLFDTDKKRQTAIVDFKALSNHPGWKLLGKIVKENIEVVTNKILDGGVKATKEQMDRLRDKLMVYKEVLNTPKATIQQFDSPEGEEIKLDPYLTVEELREGSDGSA